MQRINILFIFIIQQLLQYSQKNNNFSNLRKQFKHKQLTRKAVQHGIRVL